MAQSLTADRRLYLTRDRETVVEEGDAAAAYLLCGAGGQISLPEVARLRLSLEQGRIKQQAKPKDKARRKHEDK